VVTGASYGPLLVVMLAPSGDGEEGDGRDSRADAPVVPRPSSPKQFESF
jgi:hypothetical protein